MLEAEWRGEEAQRIHTVLEDPPRYPHASRYRYWPGPNSNTYVVWALREAAVDFDLDPRAIGKNYTPITLPGLAAIRGFGPSR